MAFAPRIQIVRRLLFELIPCLSRHFIPVPASSATPICCFSDLDKTSASGCPTLPDDLEGNDQGRFKLSIQVIPISVPPPTPAPTAIPQYYNIIATAIQADNNSQAVTSSFISQILITSPPTPPSATYSVNHLPGTWVDFCSTPPCSACPP